METTNLKQHEFYMRIYVDLAKIGKQRSDSPMGSIIVQNGVIIGEEVKA